MRPPCLVQGQVEKDLVEALTLKSYTMEPFRHWMPLKVGTS